MPEYTVKPIPVYEVRQINSQADADAWIASLTENELANTGRSFTNVRIEIDEADTMWLKFTDTSEVGSWEAAMDTDLGGYAMANKDNDNIHLMVVGETQFNLRYQPYPIESPL